MILMNAYNSVSLVSTCNATVNAECDTNGVVRFLVCCATFALSVGLLFERGVFFFGPCLFERLVTSFSFDLSLRKFKFISTCFSIFLIFFQRLVTNVCFERSLLEGLNLNPGVFFTFLMIFLIHFFDVLKRVPAFMCGYPYGCVDCLGVRAYGCVGDWHAFVRQESCKHAFCSRRFKSAARQHTPRIH